MNEKSVEDAGWQAEFEKYRKQLERKRMRLIKAWFDAGCARDGVEDRNCEQVDEKINHLDRRLG